MKKAKLSLAWQILIGLVLGIAIGAVLNHFSAEKAWWISNVLQPAGDIFIRLIKMIVIPIVISSLVVGLNTGNKSRFVLIHLPLINNPV